MALGRFVAVLVTGVAPVLAAGCGTATNAGSPAGCGHLGPGVTKSAIDVGAIFPQSGPDAILFGAVGDGIRARFHVQDDSGGIDGRKLVLDQADDGDGQSENLAAAQNLIARRHDFGVIEVSTNSDGSGSYLHDAGVPVAGWGITPAWGRYSNMFGYHYSTPSNPAGAPVTRDAAFVKSHGGHEVAVIAGADAVSVDFVKRFTATLPAFGLDLAYQDLHVTLGQSDFSFDAKAMARAGVDTLYTGLAPLTNVQVMTAAQGAGVHFKVVMLPAGYDARYAGAFSSILEGAYVSIDWRPYELPVPAHEQFKMALHDVAPETFPGQLAMVGWLSADTFIRGLKAAGFACPTRSAFIANLRVVKNYTADGLVPPTDFTALFGKMPLCYWILQIHNAAFVPVSDRPICGRVVNGS